MRFFAPVHHFFFGTKNNLMVLPKNKDNKLTFFGHLAMAQN